MKLNVTEKLDINYKFIKLIFIIWDCQKVKNHWLDNKEICLFWTNCPFPVRGVKFSFWYLMFQELKIHTFELSRLVSFFCFHALNSKHVYLFCHSLIRVSLLMNVGIISLNRFYVLKCLNAINLYLCEAISSLRFERLLPILVPPYSNLFNFRLNQFKEITSNIKYLKMCSYFYQVPTIWPDLTNLVNMSCSQLIMFPITDKTSEQVFRCVSTCNFLASHSQEGLAKVLAIKSLGNASLTRRFWPLCSFVSHFTSIEKQIMVQKLQHFVVTFRGFVFPAIILKWNIF